MGDPIILPLYDTLPIERVTVDTAHTPDWIACHELLCVPALLQLGRGGVPIADTDMGHGMHRQLTRDLDGGVYEMRRSLVMAVYRVQMPVEVDIDMHCAPLTESELRALAPGTAVFCRQLRHLFLRDDIEAEQIYLHKQVYSYEHPWMTVSTYQLVGLDAVVVRSTTAPYVLK